MSIRAAIARAIPGVATAAVDIASIAVRTAVLHVVVAMPLCSVVVAVVVPGFRVAAASLESVLLVVSRNDSSAATRDELNTSN